MYSIVSTAIVRGIESIPIRVEADVTDGMPVFIGRSAGGKRAGADSP